MTKVGQLGTSKNKLQKQLKSMLSSISPENYTKWLRSIFAVDIAYNRGLDSFISRASADNKLEILQQIANDDYGVGEIAWQNGRLVYIPSNQS